MKSINHKVRKEGANNAKKNLEISVLCDLCAPDSYRDFETFVVKAFCFSENNLN